MQIPSVISNRPARDTRPLLQLTALLALFLGSAVAAQPFDPDRYHRQCLALEQGGDYETARQSCLNALAANPRLDEARLALARIELRLGDLTAAESNLLQLRGRLGAEPHLLLADVFMRSGRYLEAEAELAAAGARIGGSGAGTLAARHAFLEADLAERRGRFAEALEHYRRAVAIDPASRRDRVRLASLLFEMGDAGAARAELEAYLSASGRAPDAELRSLFGRILWAQGDLPGAARELEAADALRGSRDGGARARDLHALGLVYYGMGDARAGALALREAARRGNLLVTFFAGNLPWLLLLLLLLAVQLIGEARIGTTSSAEGSDGPTHWSVGDVYGVAWMGLLIGIPLAVLYGVLQFDNLLAFLTPVQSNDTRAIFFVVFSLVVAWGAYRRLRRNGWSPAPVLLGGSERVGGGILLGLLLLGATLAYRAYVPATWAWRGDFVLDLAHLTPAIVVAMLLLPLSELFFRGFSIPALEGRYGRRSAVFISGSLSALVLASPALLLLAVGLALATAYDRTRSGSLVLAAHLTLNIGLLLAVSLLPWARSLFV